MAKKTLMNAAKAETPLKKSPSKSGKTNALTPNNTEAVDAFMAKLVHPLKNEMELVRFIVKNANDQIKEQVKWNAPSFFYKEDLVTFNPRMQNAVHLVFHHPNITRIKSPLLEGDYKDRRMMYLHNKEEVLANKNTLQEIMQRLVEMIE
jgi:hypothetical protein